MTTWKSRLILPIRWTFQNINFYTLSGTHIATNYNRVVIGKRGPYIEFSPSSILHENIGITDVHRITNPIYYYVEYRTRDISNVKIYLQKKTVSYADYQTGMYYISPFDLTSDIYKILVKKS